MAYRHGIYVGEQETSLSAPLNGTAGLQIVVGAAPVHLLAEPEKAVNTPLLVYSYKEAVAAVGYSADFESYPICEAISAAFQVAGVAPLVLINVLDPKKHTGDMEETTVEVENGVASVEQAGVLRDTLKVIRAGTAALLKNANQTVAAIGHKDGLTGCTVAFDEAGRILTLTLTGPVSGVHNTGAFDALARLTEDGNTVTVEGKTIIGLTDFKKTSAWEKLATLTEGESASFTVKVCRNADAVEYGVIAAYPAAGETVEAESVTPAPVALTEGTDYTTAYNGDGTVSIVLIEGGKGDGAASLTVSGKVLDPKKVTEEDLVGGVDLATGGETGLEVIRQVYPKLGLTPGILTAPRRSASAAVSAALQSKTREINGVFKCVCIADVDSSASGARKYTDVKAQKEKQALTDPNAYAVWGYGKVGDVMYSGSTLAAALTAYTDAAGGDIPYVSPSNKPLAISAMCLADGTEVLLDQEQANVVNSCGVATFLNMNGFRLWGNRTCAYPGSTDPKDSFFSCRRYMSWRANSFILTYFQKVDNPLNKRLIEAIVDSENVRGNGYVAIGAAARDEIRYNEDENPATDLMNGRITFHQYMTPYTPAEDIEDIIEFDPTALAGALS